MKLFKIFQRKKTQPIMPEPIPGDNWKTEHYNNNLKEGVLALQRGETIKIYEDGRGFELACDIKRQFILEYQRQLSERIKIEGGTIITVSHLKDPTNIKLLM